MKKFLLLVAVAVSAITVNAQRTVDIQTTLNAPANGANVRAGTPFTLNFTVKNLGPDTVKVGDTVTFFMVLGTNIQPSTQTTYVVTQPLAPDSSVTLTSGNQSVSGGTSGALQVCALVVLNMRAGVDTVRDNVAGGNNVSCNNVNYSVGIKEILGGENTVKMYPNPVSTEGTISYNLTNAYNVSVKVMDLTGRVVANVFEGHQEAGEQTVKFNAENLANGVYLYEISIDGESHTEKFIVNK